MIRYNDMRTIKTLVTSTPLIQLRLFLYHGIFKTCTLFHIL